MSNLRRHSTKSLCLRKRPKPNISAIGIGSIRHRTVVSIYSNNIYLPFCVLGVVEKRNSFPRAKSQSMLGWSVNPQGLYRKKFASIVLDVGNWHKWIGLPWPYNTDSELSNEDIMQSRLRLSIIHPNRTRMVEKPNETK